MSFADISDRERRYWQLRAVAVLGNILHRANAAGLPPITWQIPGGLRLVGTIADVVSPEELGRRFDAWAQLLDATVAGWSDPPTGRRHREAKRQGWGDEKAVTVVVLVDLYPEPVD